MVDGTAEGRVLNRDQGRNNCGVKVGLRLHMSHDRLFKSDTNFCLYMNHLLAHNMRFISQDLLSPLFTSQLH